MWASDVKTTCPPAKFARHGGALTVSFTVIIGGSKGGAMAAAPGPNFFHFHTVFRKIDQTVCCWRPLSEILDLPLVTYQLLM